MPNDAAAIDVDLPVRGISDERWKALLSFFQFILGTVVVGIFGTVINHQIQTREVEIKEQELIFKNLPAVLSTNPADKQLMAQFYATVTRSDDIRNRWIAYRDDLNKEISAKNAQLKTATEVLAKSTDAKEIEQQQNIIQTIKADLTPSVKKSEQQLSTRVYFHIKNESQRERAATVAAALSRSLGLVVPGIELVKAAPAVSQLRYFRSGEAAEATTIAQTLNEQGLTAIPTYIAGHEESQKMRPRHFELWIAQPWE